MERGFLRGFVHGLLRGRCVGLPCWCAEVFLLFLSVEPLPRSLEVFIRGEELAGEVADLLAEPHGVVWLSCVLLPLELSDIDRT